MPLEFNTVSLALGSGLDTKTDPKQTMPSKVLVLTDSIFTKSKQWRKRNGYDALTTSIVGGGSISNPKMVASYRYELICAATSSAGNRLFSYSETLSAWADVGKYNSIAVSKTVINSEVSNLSGSTIVSDGSVNPSSVTSGNITLYSFDSGSSGIYYDTLITVIDNQTGQHLCDAVSVTTGSSSGAFAHVKGFSKAVLLGTSTFAVFYIGDSTASIGSTATSTLCYRVITITSGGGVSIGVEKHVGLCKLTASNIMFQYGYDVVSLSTGAIVATPNTPNIVLSTINTSGSTVTTGPSIASTGPLSCVNITLDSTGTNAWIYWMSNSANLYFSIYTTATTPVVVVAPTAIDTGLANIQQLVALPTSATAQTLFISAYTYPGAGGTLTNGVIYPIIGKYGISYSGSTGAATAVSTFLNGADIYSRPVTISGVNYIAVITLSQVNPVGFLVDISDQKAVAKFLAGEAEGVYKGGFNLVNSTYAAPTILNVRAPGFLNTINNISSGVYYMAAGVVISFLTAVGSSVATGAAYPAAITDAATMGVASIGFNFAHIDSHQSVIQQDTLLLNGGLIASYDGASVSELGFSVDPDALSIKPKGSGGAMADGKYVYYYVYKWLDANGNLHQSAPSQGVTAVIAAGGSAGSVDFSISPLLLTQKQNVFVYIYRTINAGQIPFLVYVIQNPTIYTGIYTDTLADASIEIAETLYTDGGAILENIAPPPSMILWTNNNRAWCVDSENPETTLEYSKTASKGSGIAFSTGQLEVVIDSKNGDITGVSPMDEKTVILKERGIGYFIGDGANDSGTGANISNFQIIPSDVGCTNSKSVILYPDGLIFKSSKGIYQVNRGVQVEYFGIEVEAYNSQDIRSAQIVIDKNQIRFLTSSGSSLLYDYIFKQWSAFTNHAGLSSTTWNDLYIYVRPTGEIYEENASTFLDAGTGYAMSATTSWIRATSTQNFERVRLLEFLGDYTGQAGHGLQISTAYDFNNSPLLAVQPYLFSGGSVFQFRAFLAKQKCDALSITISEIITGASGEMIAITDLGMEIGVKRGLYKLPATASVG